MRKDQREAVERVEAACNIWEAVGVKRLLTTASKPDATVADLRILLNLAKQTSEAPTEALRDALAKCRDVFRDYEKQHALKAIGVNSPLEVESRLEKARRNGAMAAMCDAALAMHSQQSGNSHAD